MLQIFSSHPGAVHFLLPSQVDELVVAEKAGLPALVDLVLGVPVGRGNSGDIDMG